MGSREIETEKEMGTEGGRGGRERKRREGEKKEEGAVKGKRHVDPASSH